MAPNERRFNAVDGVPLMYWRWTNGAAGAAPRQLSFASTHRFYEQLVHWARDLRTLAERHGGLRGMNRIVTAGTYVNKPGQHGLGQAIDIDEVRWSNGTISPYRRDHASPDRRTRRRYLALDAVCRRHFRWVLDGAYNTAHGDHLHVDFGGGAVRLGTSSRSDTVFVQMACNAHMDSGLAVDGIWGTKTQAAFDESRRRLSVGGDPYRVTAHWQAWLGEVARCGFADRPFGPAPKAKVNLVEQLLEDLIEGLN